MQPDEPGTELPPAFAAVATWQARFIVEGVLEIVGAFMIRRAVHRAEAVLGSPPRADEGAATL